MIRLLFIAAAVVSAIALAGCESGKSSNGDPGAIALPAGQSCQSVKAQLDQMDRQGAQSKVERASQGKADPASRAIADRYNMLPNQYLGARCHA